MSSLMAPILDSCKTLMSSLDMRKISKLAGDGQDVEQIAEAIAQEVEVVEAVISDMQKRPSFGLDLSEKEAQKFDRLVSEGTSASRLARIFGQPKERVIKSLKNQGLYQSKRVAAVSPVEAKEILELNSQGLKSNEIAEKVGRDVTTVRKVIREGRPKTGSLTDREKQEVERFYLEYRLTPTQIAKLLSTKDHFRSPAPIRDHLRLVGLFYGKKTELDSQDKLSIRRYVLKKKKSVSQTAVSLKLNYNLVADYVNTFNELKFSELLTKEVRIKIRHMFKDKKDWRYVANEVLVKPSLVLAFLTERGLIKDSVKDLAEKDERKILGLLIARHKKIIEEVSVAAGVNAELVKQVAKKLK